MLTLDFEVADLARTRFAISPMSELVGGLRLLREPARVGPHLPWLREAVPLAREMELGVPLALTPSTGYMPDFLTPPPLSPVASFADELEHVRTTPPELVRREVASLFRRKQPPAAVEALLADPRSALDRMASVLDAWWRRALEPHWPRIRSLLDADLAHRARRLTAGGPAALFSDLDPTVTWRDNRLEIGTVFQGSVSLSGEGVVIVSSAFNWQGVGPIIAPPWQPTLFYPARGLELLWEPGAPAPDALSGVIGRSRADLLTALDAPRSTTELARRLELSPGAVSQHLGRLRAAGLVSATRRGREVLYLRTELAEQLQARTSASPPAT
jgi:DNA-binding transcriptional ArsR family regulator